jgi:hypothetical protein
MKLMAAAAAAAVMHGRIRKNTSLHKREIDMLKQILIIEIM